MNQPLETPAPASQQNVDPKLLLEPLETEDWRLACFMDWKSKKEAYSVTCPCCNGRGEVGGHFKDLDGPRECPQCFGTRFVTHPGPATPKPPLPAALVAHMRSAWVAYFEMHSREAGAAADPMPNTPVATELAGTTGN